MQLNVRNQGMRAVRGVPFFAKALSGVVAVVAIGATTMSTSGASVAANAVTSNVVTHTASSSVLGSAVIMRIANVNIQTNQRSRIDAIVTPRVAGRVVVLQRKMLTAWRNYAVTTTDATGTALFHVSFKAAGTYDFRTVVNTDVNYVQAVSHAGSETVAAPAPIYAGAPMGEGATGARVLALQQRLTELGYWLGGPNGSFGDATQQAVWALQKAAGLPPSGITTPATVSALVAGALPTPKSTNGNAIDVSLSKQLVMIVKNGKLQYILNTSTGGGYSYIQDGVKDVAITPPGVYATARVVDHLVIDTLGALWRPRFFYEGFAIHGDSYVPPVAESHGCVRVSNEAINWIWANNIDPIGEKIWVY